jgi:hypothetical protein
LRTKDRLMKLGAAVFEWALGEERAVVVGHDWGRRARMESSINARPTLSLIKAKLPDARLSHVLFSGCLVYTLQLTTRSSLMS